MKLRPVRIDEKPVMKMPRPAGDHVGVREGRAVGRVERPAGVDAAGDDRVQREDARRACRCTSWRRLSRGKARSFAPIMIGIRKLPSTAGIDGIRKKKTMTMPCMVKSLL